MSGIAKNKHTILIVDDNPKNLQVLGKTLREQEYQVEFALNGEDALEWVEKSDFDLILLDIMMPDISGYEVCTILKNNNKTNKIPIIFITGKTDSDSVVKGFELGAVDYIAKPFNRSELLVRVKNQLIIRNAEVEIQNYSNQLEEKNNELAESMHYAKYLQSAIIADGTFTNTLTIKYEILFKPKKIVSGDFYLIKEFDQKQYFLLADCTGHGIPGALLSMLCYSGIMTAFNEQNLRKPGKILDYVHNYLIRIFNKTQQNDSIRDGMDAVLCCFDIKKNTIEYACANNSLIHISNNLVTQLKGESYSIGDVFFKNEKLTTHSLSIQKTDRLFMFTDGFQDQFGGEKNKKFGKKRLFKTLESIKNLPINEQINHFSEINNKWRGIEEQIDDISIIGIEF